jgi:hypothetical protein
VCIPLPLSSRSKNDERKRERDKKKKRRKDHFFSSFLCKQTPQEGAIIWHLFLLFSFFFSFLLKKTQTKRVEKLRSLLKYIWMYGFRERGRGGGRGGTGTRTRTAITAAETTSVRGSLL